MFQRILVPLDGSELAEMAIPVAARIARAMGGMVNRAETVRATAEFEVGATAPTTWAPAAASHERTQAAAYLKRTAASELLAGVPTETGVYAGPVAAILQIVAETRHCDLIVMTTRGHTGLTRWVLGSVAERVAQESRIPVLLLRDHTAASLPMASVPSQTCALVALDGSEFSEAVLAPAADLINALAAPATGALHLVRVLEMVDDPTMIDLTSGDTARSQNTPAHKTQEWMLRAAKAYLAEVARRGRMMCGASAPSVTWSVVANPQVGSYETDVAAALLRTAEEGEPVKAATAPARCALIAMATHGRSVLSIG